MEQAAGRLPGALSRFLSRVPDGALGIGTAILAAFMISARLPRLKTLAKEKTPPVVREKLLPALGRIKAAIGGWLKAQARLMGLTFCILLAGFLLGKFPLKKLLTGKKTYLLCAIRLVGIPVLFGIVTWFLGVRGQLLFLSLLFTAMPLGLNLVVFPESLGYEEDAENNAKLCFVSFLLSLVTLPCIYAILTAICF